MDSRWRIWTLHVRTLRCLLWILMLHFWERQTNRQSWILKNRFHQTHLSVGLVLCCKNVFLFLNYLDWSSLMNNREKRNTNIKSVGFARSLTTLTSSFLRNSSLKLFRRPRLQLRTNKWVDLIINAIYCLNK